MGERVQVGRLIYTVYDTQWLTQLGVGLEARIPQNRFFLVRVSVANSGNRDTLAPGMILEGDDGKTYSELTDGAAVPQWIGFLRKVKPAEAAQGNIVFDAPPAHYKLRVSDESEESAALIDIPLSFASDAPQMALPEQKK